MNAKAFTVRSSRVTSGITLASVPPASLIIAVGEAGRGRKLISVPVPDGAEIIDRMIVSIPVASAAGAAIILVGDHSGFRGGWTVRDAFTSQEWDVKIGGETPPERPATWRVIAEGWCAQGDAGRMGGGPEYLAVLEDGQAIEIVRSGRLYGEPAVIRLECVDGEARVSFPRLEAESRRAAAAW